MTPDEQTQRATLSALQEALRLGLEALGVGVDTPAEMSVGQRIAHYSGALTAMLDDVAVNPLLYAAEDHYAVPAAHAYTHTAQALGTGRARRGMTIRLVAYTSVLCPNDLVAAVDPCTAAAVEALRAAAHLLTVEEGGTDADRADMMRRARGYLARSGMYALEAGDAAHGGDTIAEQGGRR